MLDQRSSVFEEEHGSPANVEPVEGFEDSQEKLFVLKIQENGHYTLTAGDQIYEERFGNLLPTKWGKMIVRRNPRNREKLNTVKFYIRTGAQEAVRYGRNLTIEQVRGTNVLEIAMQETVPERGIDFLTRIMPLFLIATALYFWFGSSIREEERKRRIGTGLFAVTIGFTIGFYDGFFGPGAGSFFTLGFVTLLGFSLLRATAHTKILNFTSNLASLIFFAAGGHVVWQLGLVMAAGQLVGGRIGASQVHRQGTRLIRPLIIGVCILISLKLLFTN